MKLWRKKVDRPAYTPKNPKRVLRLWNEDITDSSTKNLIEKMTAFLLDDAEDAIVLEINSPGGNCMHGFGLIDWMRRNIPVLVTYGYGQVSSMAVPVFLTGHYRFVGKNCSMLLHQPAKKTESSSMNANALIEEVKDLKVWTEQYLDCVMSRLPAETSRKKVLSMINNSTTLWGPKIVEMGFAQELI